MTHERRPLELGLLLFTLRHEGRSDRAVLDDLTATVQAAELAGWHAAWVTEHHFQAGLVNSSSLTTAGWLLGRTAILRVGTAIAVLPTQHPATLAEQANLLHHLSGGRFMLGVGRGGPIIEQEVLSGNLDRWRDGFGPDLGRLRVALEGSWHHEPRDRELTVVPGPGAAGGPEVLVAANSPATVEVAAASRLPMLLAPTMPTALLRSLLDLYDEACREAGHDPAGVDHVVSAVVHAGTSREAAVEEVRRAWVPWFVETLRTAPYLDEADRPTFTADDFAGMLEPQPIGTIEEVTERLRERIVVLGVRRLSLIADATGDAEKTRYTLEQIGRVVLPALQREVPRA